MSFLTACTLMFNANACKIGGAQQQRKCVCYFEQRSSWEHALSRDLKFVTFDSIYVH